MGRAVRRDRGRDRLRRRGVAGSGRRWTRSSRGWFPGRPGCRAATGSARSTPTSRSTPTPALPGAREALGGRTPARRPRRGRHRRSTRPTPGCTSTHLGLDVDALVGLAVGAGQGRGAARARRDRLRRRPRRRRRGGRARPARSASRCRPAPVTADELRGAGADVVLDDLTAFPAWLDGTCSTGGWPRSTSTCATLGSVRRSRSAAAPTRPSCWPRRSGRSAPSTSSPRPRYSDSCRRPSSTRPRGFAAEPRGPARAPRRPTRWSREGYRANAGDRCYFCKAELLDVLGPLAAELGHARTSRPAPTPTTPWPASGPGIRAAAERGAVTPLLRRRAHQGAGAGGLPRPGACPPGTSRRRPACPAGSPTASRSPRPGWPGSSGPRRRSARRWPTPAIAVPRPAGARPRRPGPASRSTRAGGGGRRGQRGRARRGAGGRLRRGRGRPAGLPVRLDERAAARPRALPLTKAAGGPRPPRVAWTAALRAC